MKGRQIAFFVSFVCVLCISSLQAQVVVLAGGGAEGDVGDLSSWSYKAYRELLTVGDRNNDGVVSVAILSTTLPTDQNWLPNYFEWIGSTMNLTVHAYNVKVDSRTKANSSATVGPVGTADVVFIRGGDQGEYYDLWNNTLLEDYIMQVYARGGGVGGTSAGAMSLAEYCFAPEQDLISTDVLYNATTSYLNDLDGGSGIHPDFLSIVPWTIIDAHYTWRARMGRLLGILAKAMDDFQTTSIQAIGIEEYTALVIKNQIGTVIGHGEVAIFDPAGYHHLSRSSGKPLLFTGITLHRLADEWKYRLDNRSVIPPAGASTVNHYPPNHSSTATVTINGNSTTDANFFEKIVSYDPYSVRQTSQQSYLAYATGFTDAFNSTDRGMIHDAIFNALKDYPDYSAILVYYDDYFNAYGIVKNSSGNKDVISFEGGLASIVVDALPATVAGEAESFLSKNGVGRTAALSPLTVHVLANSSQNGIYYNLQTHTLEGGTTPPPSYFSEREPNDYRNEANDLTGQPSPLEIRGTIYPSGDYDYFSLYLSKGQKLSLQLTIPGDVDYDLYVENSRGRTQARSVNDGLGVSETIHYTCSRNGTYYILVKSWEGSNPDEPYRLSVSVDGASQLSVQEKEKTRSLPEDFAISRAYPNPFNPTTTVSIQLPSESEVKLTIFNTMGENVYQVKTILPAGIHSLTWNGTDHAGRAVPSGLYFNQIQAGQHSSLQKILLMK